MRYHHFGDYTGEYPIAVLIPQIQPAEIKAHYLDPVDIDPVHVLVLDVMLKPNGKMPLVKESREWIAQELAPTLEENKVEYVICADAEYFKLLSGSKKADLSVGYVLDSLFGPWKIVYVPNHKAIFYDPPKVKEKIRLSMEALRDFVNGDYTPPGESIIQLEEYPETVREIQAALEYLLTLNRDLTCDIEGFSLKHFSAGIGTIAFAWDEHSGIAFAVDYEQDESEEGFYGKQGYNHEVRLLLRNFFRQFRQLGKKLIFHKIDFDVSVLIYQLYMQSITDTGGLLMGMDILMNNWDCTKQISYLATNSCAGNRLSLKEQSQEFSGNYAVEEIVDIRKIPLPKLLRYNLVDTLSTWYVHKKNYPIMVRDEQLPIYESIFKPAMLDIVQMQLTGMPVDMHKVEEADRELSGAKAKIVKSLLELELVQEFTYHLNERWAAKKNASYKKKRVTAAEGVEVFNPGSSDQVQALLFEMLGLPVLLKTDAGQPSTKGDVLDSLKNHTKREDVKELLELLCDYRDVAIIVSTFIPALKNAQQGPDGHWYLFGNFNLGGTLSGRLSSSDPNLQNLPAKSKYAKIIKGCFVAPPGWIFCGLDFASLEDKISALTTKDPEKIKVYTDGYDGHSLRSYAYYTDQMPDIDPRSVESINSIQTKYKDLRTESKTPTFALTYDGTHITLIVKCGFDEEKAKRIVKSFRDLYKVSIAWVNEKLTQAAKDGYITAAFGLRVRTPLLAQTIRGSKKTPYEATAEGRSAGNALGQSWCMLNSRAASEFMGKVRKSKHRLNIRPCAQIHDAQYYLVCEDLDALEFTNEHLVEAVYWQDDPAIAHPDVKLGGELSIFFPSWKEEVGIPNGAKAAEILEIIERKCNT